MTGGSRVLVTGASGFLGGHIVRALQSEGWRVRAAARSIPSEATGGAEWVLLPDLSGSFDARGLVEGMDAVVHLAGIAHATSAIPEARYHAVNAEAAGTLASAAKSAGVKRFLLMSSVRAQTGPSAAGHVREDQAPQPAGAYGRSKLAGELAVAVALRHSATDWVVLRPVLVYGPGVKGNMATLMRLARWPGPLPLGGFRGRRSLLSVRNLASAVSHCLRAEAASGGTFLVADPEPVTVADIVAAMRQGLGRHPRLVPVPTRPLDAMLRAMGKSDVADRLFGDLIVDTGALRATGWSPTEDTLTALARMI